MVDVFHHAAASDLLDEDDCVSLDRCIEVCDRDGNEIDAVVVNLGDSGEVNVDFLAAADVALAAGVLRKTRAGGNWLTDGISKVENVFGDLNESIEVSVVCQCLSW